MNDIEHVWEKFFLSRFESHTTMGDQLMYMPTDDTQKKTFNRLQLVAVHSTDIEAQIIENLRFYKRMRDLNDC